MWESKSFNLFILICVNSQLWRLVLVGFRLPWGLAGSVQQSDDIDLCYLTRPGCLALRVYAIAKRDRRNTKRSQLVCSVRLLAPTLSHSVTAQVWSLVTVPWIMEPLRWAAAGGGRRGGETEWLAGNGGKNCWSVYNLSEFYFLKTVSIQLLQHPGLDQ